MNMIPIEKNVPHTVSEVICVKCGKRWIAVRPSDVLLKELECPNCGQGYVIETGQELKEDCTLTDCKCNNNGKCTDGLAYKESCYDCYQTATEEKSCKNCGHGFDSEDCYKCDKNIQNTCEPNQTATKEGE